MPKSRPIYMTTGEVARHLGVSPSAVNLWAKEGLLTYHLTPGGHRRFKFDEVAALGKKRNAKQKTGNDHQ